MITIKEIIQRVQSLYSKGVESDDTRLSSRHIYSILKSVRSILLKRKKASNDNFSKWEIQTIPCVKLIEADIHECPCIPPAGCKILRSENKIPKPLNVKGKDSIISVTNLNGNVIFSETSWEAKKYKKGNKYTSTKPDYFIRNEYLYVTVNKTLKLLSISGVFDDPLKVESFKSFCDDCEDCDCNSNLEKQFWIDESLISPAIEMTLKELDIFFRGIEDKSNNTSDSPLENSK